MKTEVEITWNDNKTLNLIFLGFNEEYLIPFESFARRCWTNSAVVKLFDRLFEKNRVIFVANSAIDLNSDEYKSEVKKIDLSSKEIEFISESFKNEEYGVIGQQARNLIVIFENHFKSITNADERFFSTVTHEIVHYIDSLLTNSDETVYYKLTPDGKKKMDWCKNNLFNKIRCNSIFSEYHLENMVEHEIITYCVEVYMLSLLCCDDEIINSLAEDLSVLTDVVTNEIWRKK